MNGNNKLSIVEMVAQLESPSTSSVISQELGVALARAEGISVWDEYGKHYIDLTAGSGVHNVGHNHPLVTSAIITQLQQVTHTGWQFPCPPRATLLGRLAQLFPFDDPRFIFTVTGSEAVEAGLKVARLTTGSTTILSFLGGYHGKTGGSLSVTANPRLRSGVVTAPAEPIRFPYPDETTTPNSEALIQWLEQIFTHPDFPHDEVAGIIVEPIQGSSGMIAPPGDFLQALRLFTQKYQLLMIVDEIFTGIGRTGSFLAIEQSSIIPDIIIMGKALGGGLPISLVAAPAAIMQHIPPYKQTSTFSGHPLACAAGLAVLDILEQEQLPSNAIIRGQQLRNGLSALSNPQFRITVTGRGLMLGVRIDAETRETSRLFTRTLVHHLQQCGLLALSGGLWGNVIKVTPPLTLNENDVQTILERFANALQQCQAQFQQRDHKGNTL